jgi:hypothetical protein
MIEAFAQCVAQRENPSQDGNKIEGDDYKHEEFFFFFLNNNNFIERKGKNPRTQIVYKRAKHPIGFYNLKT